jgi:N-acetylneuraminate synthase
MEPAEFASLVTETERAWRALGKVSYGPVGAEKESLKFRRSLYVVADMKAGDAFTPANLRAIRPGDGLPPKFLDMLMGRRVTRAVKRGTGVTWDLVMKDQDA